MQKLHSIGLNLRRIFALAVLFLALSGFEQARAFEISITNVNVLGREIKVIFYKPDGAGPFPLLVLSHGSPRNAAERNSYGETDSIFIGVWCHAGNNVANYLRRYWRFAFGVRCRLVRSLVRRLVRCPVATYQTDNPVSLARSSSAC